MKNLTETLTQTPTFAPSTHEFAEVIHRLEAGGSMLPDTPENLMQIIGIYKAYATHGFLLARLVVHCRASFPESFAHV